MIIDKVNEQVVPRYLIYDIIKFNVSIVYFVYVTMMHMAGLERDQI